MARTHAVHQVRCVAIRPILQVCVLRLEPNEVAVNGVAFCESPQFDDSLRKLLHSTTTETLPQRRTDTEYVEEAKSMLMIEAVLIYLSIFELKEVDSTGRSIERISTKSAGDELCRPHTVPTKHSMSNRSCMWCAAMHHQNGAVSFATRAGSCSLSSHGPLFRNPTPSIWLTRSPTVVCSIATSWMFSSLASNHSRC